MKKIIFRRALPLICLPLLVVAVVYWPAVSPFDTGGELQNKDFRGEYDVFVEESYTLLMIDGVYEEAEDLHTVWRITDEGVKGKIFKLCSKIKGYKEIGPEGVYLGAPHIINNLPRIYFAAGEFGYAIEIVNWDMYTDGMAIKNELYPLPAVIVWRYDMPQRTSGDGFYRLIKDDTSRDSAWYSTLSRENMDTLMALLVTVDDSCADFNAYGDIF